MRILLLSFYYPPDLGAGSFRSEALVRALIEAGGPKIEVDVITTMPNRYASHMYSAPAGEKSGGIRIHRVRMRAHQSGMWDQSLAFLDYARGTLRQTRAQKWDIVVATSSRLMTAALGAHIAGRAGAPLYLDVRDLFTDTMRDVLAGRPLKAVLPVLRWIERHTLLAADRINLVSQGFLPYVCTVTGREDFPVFTNGIDDEFLSQDFNATSTSAHRQTPLILYAGNIGEGQGLERVVPQAAKLLEGKANFRLIGDGGAKRTLESALKAEEVSNVELLPPVPRERLMEHYRQADVLLLHLNDHPAFRKVLPSKLFEYGATGKRILAGVAGYPAQFVTSELSGAEVFSPCDPTGLVHGFERLIDAPEHVDRTCFRKKYSRHSIMMQLAGDILSIGTLKS